MVGSPYLGADPVGAVALTAGVCIAAAICTGGWLTLPRLAGATVAGLRGDGRLRGDRPAPAGAGAGSLGRFLQDLADGTGGSAMHRAGAANVEALLGSPLTVLAVVGAVLVWFALLRDWGGLKRAFGLYPALRAGLIGIAVAAVIGGVLGGSALTWPVPRRR